MEAGTISTIKESFGCSECGAQHNKWQGQCRECEQWGTLSAVLVSKKTTKVRSNSEVQTLGTIGGIDNQRTPTFSRELDRVLGGGLVSGSVVLLGGQPGAGKSTLLLQTAAHLAQGKKVIYVSGEESPQQISQHAQRLKLSAPELLIANECSVQRAIELASGCQILIIDSIQVMLDETLTATAGSVSQVRQCAGLLTQFAKNNNCAVFLVGHVNKEGALAGPKVLEHIIDCSLLLEISEDNRFRTLRALKNRFGSVNELGIFAMTASGMKAVKNPSAIFLSPHPNTECAGSIVTVAWEGTRPLLVEIQALVDSGSGAYARRVSVGIDHNRPALLLAVLHRHGGISLATSDVFLNLVGGLKVEGTSVDLALALAVVSSHKNHNLSRQLAAFGEIGLTGEIRPVPYGLERINEAAKHGFSQIIVPQGNAPKKPPANIKVTPVATLNQALSSVF